jgi:YesN/AraC family two-component response regulator
MSHKPKILIVDDELRMCESIKTLINDNSYEIFTANNGKEAIEYLNKGNFDIVLLDIVMPEVDGGGIMDFGDGFLS